MSAAQPGVIAEEIFVGDSEMGALMRSHDWSQTPLGSVEHWSKSLKVAVNICLNSRFPMVIWWGEELTLLYNDAWRPILGNKHPQALGKPGQEVWSEIWDIVGTQLHSVLTTGKATWSDDQLLLVNRYGYTEEAYFTYSYSPIFLETGEVGGAFTAVAETTQRVVGERRLATLRNLAAQTGQSKTVEQACQKAIQTLSENSSDIPLALLYLLNSEETQATLQAQAPAQIQPLIAPVELDLTQQSDPFTQALATVIQSNQQSVIENLVQFWGEFPVGPVRAPLQQAIALPIRASTQDSMVGVLVLGANPYRALDDDQRQFLEMTTGHIANAIASARTYEAERKRAEALAELDRAKTAFFSNVSHEFRTPLTLMLGPLEEMLSKEGVIPPEQHQPLELIHRNSLRLLKLVNTLLDFSRIEAGRVQAVYEPTDLATFTAELASVFRSAIEQAGLQFIVACEPLPKLIYVDREMWEKIVLNLLSNAFKFTFSGKIAVTLRQVQNQVELVVRDTGIGIPTAELPRLFERFHRVEGARGRTQEGSGIGLALVQELVRLHGGQVQVESIEGECTTFTVTIPTGMAHLPSDRIQATRTLASTALGAAPYVEEALRWLPEEDTETRGHGDTGTVLPDFSASSRHPLFWPSPSSARILLVDDNTDMRNYVKRLLLSQGYEVETAADGMAALAIIEQQIPNLVLTDVMMPQLDGFGLLRELRTAPTTREIPIILLSARAGEEARVEGLEAGADDYLTKPFSARELLARVEASLKLAQLRREAMQREQALRLEAETAKQTVETILSSISDGFYTLDRNWCYTYVNDRYCEMAGMKREALLGQNVWELFSDAVGTDVYIQFQWAMSEQIPLQFEYLYATWNHWYEHRVYPSFNGLTVFITEITARKQAEAALQQSEARFRLMAETIQDVFWITDFRSPKILYVSPAYEQIWGRSPDEIYQNYTLWAETIHPDDRERTLAIAATCQNNDIVEQEYRIVRPDGTIRWIRDRGFAVRDEAGQIQQVVGVAQDITERQLAVEALKQSEAKFRRLVEVSMFGVAIGDFSGNILYANDSLLNMIGYSREELEAGQIRWLDLTPPEQVHLDWEAGEELRQRGVCKAFEKEYIHKDGHRVPILIGAALLGEPYADQELIIGFYLDLTELKQAEATVRHSEQQLRVSQELSLDAFTILDSVRDETGAIVDFVWTYVNPKAAEILQRSVEELMGQRLLKVLPGNQTNSELFERYVRVVETGEAHDIELSYGADGITGWFRNMAVKLEDGVAISFSDISDRKQIEEALRQSEERLRVALQNAPITVFNQDCELKYTWIYNPVLYNLHEMLGKHDRDYLPPEDAEPLTAIKQRVLETGIGVRQEIKITRNETSYYYDLTVEPLRDNSSAIVGITCAAIDVSELKRTEFDLRESEARFRAIVNQATAGIAQTDLTGQFILVNQRYCNIVGYSMEELLQKRMQDITHPDDIPRNTELFQRMVTEGREFVIEKRYLRKDGSEVWVNNSVSVVRDKSGNPQSAVAVVLDVSDAHRQATQRKQVEEALRENEARLRMAIASAQLGTWDWNLVTGELKWDIGCKAMFGLPPDAESSIEVFFEGLHPDDRDRLQDVVQVSLNPASGGVYDTEYRTIGIQDNVERWIRAKGQAYFDAAGKPLRFIGTVLDITEQKQAAAQREQLLQREQVAREAAERANRIKDEFLAVLSHELRSPLNPILGWAKLLQTRQFDAQGTKRALQTIERNAKLQAQLIEDLLDVSRILRGKMVLNVCPVNLVTVVESALETVRLAAQAKQIQIQTVLSRENPEVSGDAARLQQIVWNLLSNAVKFTPDGGRVEVSLSLVNRHSSVEGSDALRTNNQGQMTKYAQIQVKDTGKGISPDFLPYVFDYFRQEDGKTTRKFGGLGLGLAIVRHLTELHGGTVHAESLGEGQGATFIVRLPLMSEATELAKENLTTAQFIDLSQLRILVVDDDEDMRELTQVILEQQGAQVIVAATAAEALRVFDRQPPDIFIGDIGMPEIDGYMLMQQIRSRSPEQGGLVSAIALTAYAGEYDQQQALHAGFQRHVAKPVEPEALVRAVADLVRNR